MKNKTLNNWIQLNRAFVFYKALGVGALCLCMVLALVLFFKINENPIVIVYDGESKSHLVGERKNDVLTQNDLKKFILDFIKSRYTWNQLEPSRVLESISCQLTGRFLKKLEKKLAKSSHQNKKGENIEQYAAFVRAKVDGEKFTALFDKVVRVNGIPFVTPSRVSLSIVRDVRKSCNPQGLYIDGIHEKDLP